MYYLWLNQGGGCDYTIGCGEKLIPLKTTPYPIEKHLKEIKQIFEDYGIGHSERQVSEAKVLKFDRDVMSLVEERILDLVCKEQQEELAEKRKQLEKLKRELGEK